METGWTRSGSAGPFEPLELLEEADALGADPRGGALHNEAIALERARAVQRYLIRRGVSPTRIEIASRGERQALGEAPESWMYDRRVEIHLLQAPGRER